jgi:exopolyphosphatase/guanosine-5'-triphosphate,3'-diphosphate pyrophosphatase
LAEAWGHKQERSHRDTVMAAARDVGRKYFFNAAHGTRTADFAVRLFDQTRSLHKLGERARLLLEAAALLHDVGRYIGTAGHHRHSYYLIKAEPLGGLSEEEREIVANAARYHRKSLPALGHEGYRALSAANRAVATKLGALVRLADALDARGTGKVQGLSLSIERGRCVLRISGDEDLLAEKLAVIQKADLFEKALRVKLAVEEKRNV